ncbi:MAG: hypothetical protein WDW38_010353 [Sanguina aurantia]
MCEFGRRGAELLREVQSHGKISLPAYNEDLIRLVYSEVQEHDLAQRHILRRLEEEKAAQEEEEGGSQEEQRGSLWDDHPKEAVTFFVHLQAIKRNKRHLLIYAKERLSRLQRARWMERGLPPALNDAASPQELEFYRDYDKALTTYMGKASGIGMDLTLDALPPRDLLVSVKGLKDSGETIFSFGRYNILKDVQYLLPCSEAEPLIREGLVEEIMYG